MRRHDDANLRNERRKRCTYGVLTKKCVSSWTGLVGQKTSLTSIPDFSKECSQRIRKAMPPSQTSKQNPRIHDAHWPTNSAIRYTYVSILCRLLLVGPRGLLLVSYQVANNMFALRLQFQNALGTLETDERHSRFPTATTERTAKLLGVRHATARMRKPCFPIKWRAEQLCLSCTSARQES